MIIIKILYLDIKILYGSEQSLIKPQLSHFNLQCRSSIKLPQISHLNMLVNFSGCNY